MIDVREYLDTKGRSPYAAWFDSLKRHGSSEGSNGNDPDFVGELFECARCRFRSFRIQARFWPRRPDLFRQGWRHARHSVGRRLEETPTARDQYCGRQLAGLQTKEVGDQDAADS